MHYQAPNLLIISVISSKKKINSLHNSDDFIGLRRFGIKKSSTFFSLSSLLAPTLLYFPNYLVVSKDTEWMRKTSSIDT